MATPDYSSQSLVTRIRFWTWLVFAALMLPFCVVKGWQEYADRRWGRQSGYEFSHTSSSRIRDTARTLVGMPFDQVETRLTATFPQLRPDNSLASNTSSSDAYYSRVLRDTQTGDMFRFHYRDGVFRYITIRQSNPLLGTEPDHYEALERVRETIQSTSAACWGILFLALLLVARLTKIREPAVVQRLLVHLLCMAMLAVCVTWALEPNPWNPWGWYQSTDTRTDQWAVLSLIIATLIAVLLTYRRKKTPPLGFCLNCGYNLTGNISGICPECGTPVPAEMRETLAGDVRSA